jgi:hypothetical protein
MKRYEIALWGLFPMTYSMVKGSALVSKTIAKHYHSSKCQKERRVARVYKMFG